MSFLQHAGRELGGNLHALGRLCTPHEGSADTDENLLFADERFGEKFRTHLKRNQEKSDYEMYLLERAFTRTPLGRNSGLQPLRNLTSIQLRI